MGVGHKIRGTRPLDAAWHLFVAKSGTFVLHTLAVPTRHYDACRKSFVHVVGMDQESAIGKPPLQETRHLVVARGGTCVLYRAASTRTLKDACCDMSSDVVCIMSQQAAKGKACCRRLGTCLTMATICCTRQCQCVRQQTQEITRFSISWRVDH